MRYTSVFRRVLYIANCLHATKHYTFNFSGPLQVQEREEERGGGDRRKETRKERETRVRRRQRKKGGQVKFREFEGWRFLLRDQLRT